MRPAFLLVIMKFLKEPVFGITKTPSYLILSKNPHFPMSNPILFFITEYIVSMIWLMLSHSNHLKSVTSG